MIEPTFSRPLLTDRTTIETDQTCGMKRWWYKHEGGTGIVPAVEAKYFLDGRQYHEDFALLAEADDPLKRAKELIEAIEEKLGTETDQIFLETQTRRAAWIAANGLFIEPELRLTHRTIHVEWELVLDRSPLWVAVTPDRVLERISDGKLIYRDYKGVGGWGATYNWMNHWPYAIQLHTVIAAVQEELDRPVAYAQIMGLAKGQERDGKLSHPYVWAYSDGADEWMPVVGDGYYYEAKKKGLTKRPVWEYAGGILKWVSDLGPDVARNQFPFSAPVFLNERLLNWLVKSRTRREKELDLFGAKCQTDLDARLAHFPPNFNECRPVVGTECPYLAACHNATVNSDPLRSGMYVVRTPHHDLETTMKGEDNE